MNEILQAYAEGVLTADEAAKKLANEFEASAVDLQLDVDKDLRAALTRELHARGHA